VLGSHLGPPPIECDFSIYFLSRFCKNIWSARSFAKLYLCLNGPRRQGHNAVVHDGRSRQQWARRSYRYGPRRKVLTPWAMALGAYRQAVAWPPGNTAGHDGMYGPTVVGCSGRFFFVNFNF
jgi:hypothetical protein